MPILLKLHMCFGHGLKTCMWFGYNPQIIFCHFFRNLNLVFFSGIITINFMQTVCTFFLEGAVGGDVSICMYFGFFMNPAKSIYGY